MRFISTKKKRKSTKIKFAKPTKSDKNTFLELPEWLKDKSKDEGMNCNKNLQFVILFETLHVSC